MSICAIVTKKKKAQTRHRTWRAALLVLEAIYNSNFALREGEKKTHNIRFVRRLFISFRKQVLLL